MDTYWRFAAERQAMYVRRLAGGDRPWTDDPILGAFRFTNPYRAADRVSQFLIADVQYGRGRSQAVDEVFFRTMLFKTFNKIVTWSFLEERLGPLSWQSADRRALAGVLDQAFATGVSIYSAAYIMPSPRLGSDRKHLNHLALLWSMMEQGLPARVRSAGSLPEVYRLLATQPGLGPFLAFQYAIDLNYSSLIDFDEADFVVAGPGALDGISKCFSTTGGLSPEAVIAWTHDNQEGEFASRGLVFPGLFGRRLQPVDCQNLYCEISKYARVAHPDVPGVSDRVRIKQRYRENRDPLPVPFFPPKWRLSVR